MRWRIVPAVLLGVVAGLAGGHVLWSHPNARLRQEIARTRTWLFDEVKLSEARAEEIQRLHAVCSRVDAELEEARAALASARTAYEEARARLDVAASGWRTEQERRRSLELQMAAATRERTGGEWP